jgi:hypothetical protein
VEVDVFIIAFAWSERLDFHSGILSKKLGAHVGVGWAARRSTGDSQRNGYAKDQG